MHNYPTISVITPCLNARTTIQRTMDSIAAQTKQPLEYLIIDGGSTDGTIELAQRHTAVTQVISAKDRGISDAFNKGIAMAQGEIIGIINADDWYEANTIELVTVAMANSAIGIAHGTLQYWNGSQQLNRFYPNINNLKLEMTLNHPTVFVRRACYERFGKFNEHYRFAMDYELLLRMYCNGVQFVEIPHVLSNMSILGASDRHWIVAYTEVAKAKSTYLHAPIAAWLYFAWQVVRSGCRMAMEKMGLYGVIKKWRHSFSVMRKS